ncbi:MAG TPA: hypothetical protein VG860_19285 [Terriglobia bacterium]|jgi:hypothetical protein|nr:hypothetical protein [Terriglobia bacterium]
MVILIIAASTLRVFERRRTNNLQLRALTARSGAGSTAEAA